MSALLYTEPLLGAGAELSACKLHRYLLWRTWSPNKPPATFVMLNPSTAQASTDDHTVRKCIGFAQRWGFGGIRVVNLYSLRSTDWHMLIARPDRTGPANGQWLESAFELAAAQGQAVVVAWGAHRVPEKAARVAEVRSIARRHGVELLALGTTFDGDPCHPLMLSYSTPLEPWSRAA